MTGLCPEWSATPILILPICKQIFTSVLLNKIPFENESYHPITVMGVTKHLEHYDLLVQGAVKSQANRAESNEQG